MLKVIAGACRHPTNRSLADFHAYWSERHGPLFARTPELCGYIQHHTLPEAYGVDPKPTHHGASLFWYADLETLCHPPQSPRLSEMFGPQDGDLYDWYVRAARYGDPETLTLRETVFADDRQLFDRSPDWPLHPKRTSVVAEERIVVEGSTAPTMVKVIYTASRLPGISLKEFSSHWFEVHGALVAELPGLRRYVQNHAVPEAYAVRGVTHDCFGELWFDDLAALQHAFASPEWQALREDGRSLFAHPVSVVVARELVIKPPHKVTASDWSPRHERT